MVKSWSPLTLAEALEVKRSHQGVLPYAGGTDYMATRKEASSFLFLNRIPELKEVFLAEEGLFIGSLATYTQLIDEPLVPEFLKVALKGVAAPAIRNMGTLGGNICNASPAGDSLPVLYVLDAVLVLASLREDGKLEKRHVPIEEFILGVRKTALLPEELLTGILLPRADLTHTCYEKVGARRAQAISKLSFAGAARVEKGELKDFRAAFGSVGPRVVRDRAIEALALNKPFEAEALTEAYRGILHPIDDQRSTAVYRKTVCLNLLKDFLDTFTKK